MVMVPCWTRANASQISLCFQCCELAETYSISFSNVVNKLTLFKCLYWIFSFSCSSFVYVLLERFFFFKSMMVVFGKSGKESTSHLGCSSDDETNRIIKAVYESIQGQRKAGPSSQTVTALEFVFCFCPVKTPNCSVNHGITIGILYKKYNPKESVFFR